MLKLLGGRIISGWVRHMAKLDSHRTGDDYWPSNPGVAGHCRKGFGIDLGRRHQEHNQLVAIGQGEQLANSQQEGHYRLELRQGQ